jgi:hypothetical protein
VIILGNTLAFAGAIYRAARRFDRALSAFAAPGRRLPGDGAAGQIFSCPASAGHARAYPARPRGGHHRQPDHKKSIINSI